MELTLCYLIPLDSNILHLRNNVTIWGIHFGKLIVNANWHAFKYGNTGFIGSGCHTDFLTVNRGAGKFELKSVYKSVFGGLDHLDAAILTKVCDVQCNKRTVVVNGNIPCGITIRLIVHGNLGFFDNVATIGNLTGFCISFRISRTDNGNFFTIVIIYSEFSAAEIFTRLIIGFQNLDVALFKFIRRIDGRERTFCSVNGNCPLGLTISLIIERERRLDYAIGSVRNIYGFGITTVVGRSNGGYFGTRGVIDGEYCAAKSTVVLRSFLINLNVTFFQLIHSIDGNNTIVGRADGTGPFLCARIGIVCREHSLYDFICAVRKVFLGSCITVRVCRTDTEFFAGLSIGSEEVSTAEVLTVRILLVHFNLTGFLYELRHNYLNNSFRIIALGHTFNSTYLRTTVVTNVGNKVNSVVFTGIDGNVSNATGWNMLKCNKRTDRDFFTWLK